MGPSSSSSILLCVAVLATLPGAAASADAGDTRRRTRSIDALLAAITAQDTTAFVAQLTKLPIGIEHIAWNDPRCATQFNGARTIHEVEIDAFVRCLGTLGLLADPEEPGRALSYGPGFRVIVHTSSDGTISRMTSLRGELANHVPYRVTARNLIGTARQIPVSAEKQRIDAAPGAYVSAHVELCIDAKGKVASAKVTPGIASASFATQVERAATRWRYKPFRHRGKAVAVCSDNLFVYPEGLRSQAEQELRDGGVEGGVVGGAP